jgi:hypothetical protein
MVVLTWRLLSNDEQHSDDPMNVVFKKCIVFQITVFDKIDKQKSIRSEISKFHKKLTFIFKVKEKKKI